MALCGEGKIRDADSHPLTAVCSRLFKHILPEHADLIAYNLRKWIDDNLNVIQAEGFADDGDEDDGGRAVLQAAICLVPQLF